MSPAASKLPTYSLAEVASKNTNKECWVILKNKVYDVTDFLEDHPGGGDLILEWGGKDVEDILMDQVSHLHTEAAYEILDDSIVGHLAPADVAASKQNGSALKTGGDALAIEMTADGKKVYASTGMAGEEDLSVDTDVKADFRKHKFLDLERPLLMQVWRGGFTKDFYLEQVHRPRHYRGGASAPLFGNFLEPLSLTPWWVVPTLWVPPVSWGLMVAARHLSAGAAEAAAYFCVGLGIWTIIEYCLHRFLFHIERALPDNRVGITLHFLLHGIHHYLPMDRMRLVMPPALLVVLATPFWYLAHAIFFYNYYAAQAVFCGGILGYISYDLTHYFLHHKNLPFHYRELKKYHLQHHFADFENGFGVTSRFWDRVFGTELQMPQVIKSQ